MAKRSRSASRILTPREFTELERVLVELLTLRDSLLFQEKYDISITSKDESIQEFQQFGSDLEIDFQDYQLEEKQVKLLQRFKSFLFQPLDLEVSDPNFASAFCAAIR